MSFHIMKHPKNIYYKWRQKAHAVFNNIKHKNIRTIRYNAKTFHDQISEPMVKYPAGCFKI